MNKIINNIYHPSNIDGLIPGIKGHRAFPSSEFRNADPFLMLDHIGPQKVGRDYLLDGKAHAHPHRGFETLTFMFEGRMDHVDSLGNKVSLQSGSVQRMNAGSGIIHGGDMGSDPHSERFHEVQLWINNPKEEKMSKPDVHNVSSIEIPQMKSGNLQLKVVSGELNSLTGPIKTKAKTRIGHLIAQGEGEMKIGTFSPNERLFLYVLEGELNIQDQRLEAFQLVEFSEEGESLLLTSSTSFQALLLCGIALEEAVVFGGPFVMSSEEEIREAQLDYQLGRFGKIN